jgi:hypothetical protein
MQVFFHIIFPSWSGDREVGFLAFQSIWNDTGLTVSTSMMKASGRWFLSEPWSAVAEIRWPDKDFRCRGFDLCSCRIRFVRDSSEQSHEHNGHSG